MSYLPGDPGLPPGVSNNTLLRDDGDPEECEECGGTDFDDDNICRDCGTEHFTAEQRADRAEEDAADQRDDRY